MPIPFFSTLIAQNKATGKNDSIFGTVSPPPGVGSYNDAAGQAANDIGLVLFLSNLIRIVTIVGGVAVMINFIYAGWIYLTSSGDSSAHKKVVDILTFSVIGLVIIVASYAAASLIGLLFFDDATFILNPTICGPEGC